MMEGPSEEISIMHLAIAAVIALVVVGAVMVPIIDAACGPTQIVHTFTNIGDPYKSTDSRTHTVEIALSGDAYVIRTDGVQIDTMPYTPDVPDPFAGGGYSRIISFGSDSLAVFYSIGYMIVYCQDTQYRTADVTAGSPLTLTITDVLSYTDENGVQRTASVTLFAGRGEFEYANSTDPEYPVYIMEDTDVKCAQYARLMTRGSVPVYIGYVGSGTVGDYSLSVLDPEEGVLESTTFSMTYEENEDHLSNPMIDIRSEWETYGETNLYISTVFVPKTVSYTEQGEGKNITAVLMGVIPVVAVLGILVGVASYMRPDVFKFGSKGDKE